MSRFSDNPVLSAELQADNRNPFLSETGRYVVFESFSDQLADDDNNQADILRKDRDTGLLQLVSATQAGTSGNAASLEPAVSDDGNVVAFRSGASDLVAGDTNGRLDIFVRDVSAGVTERVSVASDGSEANQNSFEPDISGDGRFVVFRSNASNLVPGDTNQRPDIFVHDRLSGATERIGQPPGGQSNGSSANPSISGDGRWIVFESDASNLVTGDTNEARDIFRAPNPLFTAGAPLNRPIQMRIKTSLAFLALATGLLASGAGLAQIEQRCVLSIDRFEDQTELPQFHPIYDQVMPGSGLLEFDIDTVQPPNQDGLQFALNRGAARHEHR